MAIPISFLMTCDQYYIYVRNSVTGALEFPLDQITGNYIFNLNENDAIVGYGSESIAWETFYNYEYPEKLPNGIYHVFRGTEVSNAI